LCIGEGESSVDKICEAR